MSSVLQPPEYNLDAAAALVAALTVSDRLVAGLTAGDARLDGRLDLIDSATVDPVRFTPGTLARKGQADELTLLPTGGMPAWETGQERVARVALPDGRKLSLRFAVKPPRPRASLIA